MYKQNRVQAISINVRTAQARNLPLLVGTLALFALLASCQPVHPVADIGEVAAPANVSITPFDSNEDVTESAEDVVTDETHQTSVQPVDTENTNTEIADTEYATPSTATSEAVEVEVIDEELALAGMLVYRAQYCGICHELSPAGTTGRFGPPHDGAVAAALLRLEDSRYAGEATNAAEYFYESLVEPSAYLVEGYVGTSHSMPPYTHLSEDDLHALVALLLAQR